MVKFVDTKKKMSLEDRANIKLLASLMEDDGIEEVEKDARSRNISEHIIKAAKKSASSRLTAVS